MTASRVVSFGMIVAATRVLLKPVTLFVNFAERIAAAASFQSFASSFSLRLRSGKVPVASMTRAERSCFSASLLLNSARFGSESTIAYSCCLRVSTCCGSVQSMR